MASTKIDRTLNLCFLFFLMFSLRAAEKGGEADFWSIPLEAPVRFTYSAMPEFHTAL